MRKNRILLSFILILALMFSLTGAVYAKKPADDPVPNPDPGQKTAPATPNISFPIIATDIIDVLYMKMWVDEDLDGIVDDGEFELGYDGNGDDIVDNILGIGVPVPIPVLQSIVEEYEGSYDGNEGFYYNAYVVNTDTGCYVDLVNNLTLDEGPDGEPDLVFMGTDYVYYYDKDYDGTIEVDEYDFGMSMAEWLTANELWYDQPVWMDTTVNIDIYSDLPDYLNPNNIWNIAYLDGSDNGGENSWQADWKRIVDVEFDETTGDPILDDLGEHDAFVPLELGMDAEIEIDFIDWGNPLENNTPVVGQRFPIELAFYERITGSIVDHTGTTLDTMTAYKMACLELPSTRNELFGTSDLDGTTFTKEIKFATVLTNKFEVIVEAPNGKRVPVTIEPGIGPSGKMNFASAGGGWIPEVAGEHTIWFYLSDPMISLSGAEINDDEHYIMSSGCKAEDLNHNKAAMSGIIGDSITYINVMVVKPSKNK